MKVVLEIVNRTRKEVNDVKLMDLVPQLTQIVKESKHSVVAPSKIVSHKQQGTLLHWNFDKFEGKEHRIIAYKLLTINELY